MTTKDLFAIAAIVFGVINALFNYIIFWKGRKDIYEGDYQRARGALIWATFSFQLLLIAAACWVCCLIDGIA